jgi:hypothetical protein
VAEGGGLLNRYTVISRIVGSNPIPSANTAETLAFPVHVSFFNRRRTVATVPVFVPASRPRDDPLRDPLLLGREEGKVDLRRLNRAMA